jgi:hypothetical protein
MNRHLKSLRHLAIVAATAIVWGVAELIALQRARLGERRR